MNDQRMRVRYLRDHDGNVRAAIGMELVADGVLNCATCIVSEQDEFCKKTARSILKSRLIKCESVGSEEVCYTRSFKKYESRCQTDCDNINEVVGIFKQEGIGMIEKGVGIEEYKKKVGTVSDLISILCNPCDDCVEEKRDA